MVRRCHFSLECGGATAVGSGKRFYLIILFRMCPNISRCNCVYMCNVSKNNVILHKCSLALLVHKHRASWVVGTLGRRKTIYWDKIGKWSATHTHTESTKFMFYISSDHGRTIRAYIWQNICVCKYIIASELHIHILHTYRIE